MTFLILSNGHGEDVIGASFVREILEQNPKIKVSAFPTVDDGKAYQDLGIEILGERKIMPSGGFIFHNYELFKKDIKAGFVQMTLRQIYALSKIRADVVLVVGDIYALFLSSFIKTNNRFYYQSLVSIHHAQKEKNKLANRYFMEHFSYFERAMMRHLVKQAYMRDGATADYLKNLGLSRVAALGNPMLDSLGGLAMLEHKQPKPTIAILPGTRKHANKALTIILASLSQLETGQALVSWAGDSLSFDYSSWQKIASNSENGLILALQKNDFRVYFYKNRFADILASADIVIGNAGTAHEQAASLGIPIISFAVEPTYKPSFIANQKRLLGQALHICKPEAEKIAAKVLELLENKDLYNESAKAGKKRMGEAGGSKRIITDILEKIDESY